MEGILGNKNNSWWVCGEWWGLSNQHEPKYGGKYNILKISLMLLRLINISDGSSLIFWDFGIMVHCDIEFEFGTL